jgi:CheY-like chemotaxis protein
VPDIIISDYHLASGARGDEVIARLRKRFGQSVPAFLMSGDISPDSLREARASGFQLLHKPVAPMKLRLMLNQLLRSPASV